MRHWALGGGMGHFSFFLGIRNKKAALGSCSSELHEVLFLE
jgi:hypothetical protein